MEEVDEELLDASLTEDEVDDWYEKEYRDREEDWNVLERFAMRHPWVFCLVFVLVGCWNGCSTW